MKKVWSLGVMMVAVLLAASLMLGVAPEVAAQNSDNEIPGRYIVLLQAGGDTADNAGKVGKKHGLAVDLVYTSVHGAALAGAAGKLKDLKDDPDVRSAEPDRRVSLTPFRKHQETRLDRGSFQTFHTNNFETLTTGIDRIDAELNPRTDVSAIGVAIIDTGVWKTHVDLNVAGGYSCASTDRTKWNDDNGHGTHVAGIAAAKTNDNKGVRGVAPNARLYGVKVLNRNGSGFLSWVVCGVDWVTKNAAVNGIKVANMSLAYDPNFTALNTAVSASVAAGVTYAVAAGNATSSTLPSPGNNPDVITVSAMGDSDGKCGGLGPNTSYGADDSFASFSNFGPLIELAAPGVDIWSTWLGDKLNPGGYYAQLSGTSMASPHVAGAAAQYKASNPGASPSQVRSALIAAGVPQGQACAGNGNGGFSGDTDGFAEPLLRAASL